MTTPMLGGLASTRLNAEAAGSVLEVAEAAGSVLEVAAAGAKDEWADTIELRKRVVVTLLTWRSA
jgi:hypothetical protein